MKKDDLSSKIDEIEREIQAFKTNQKTQNDSYSIYTYSSGDIAYRNDNGGQRKYRVEFLPKNPNQGKILCQFFLIDLMAVQYRSYATAKGNNPLVSYSDIFAYKNSDPAWRKHAYITCLVICEGEIIVSYETIW